MKEPEFELQLRTLRPHHPTRELEQRVARALRPAMPPRCATCEGEIHAWWERYLPGLGWAAVGAAASIITMLSLNLLQTSESRKNAPPSLAHHPAPPPVPTRSQPLSDEEAVTERGEWEATDEGVFESGANGLSRRVRYSTVERRSWKDDTGAVTVVEVPREDIVVVPVNFQ